MISRITASALLAAAAMACAPAAEQTADTMEADLEALRAVRAQEVAGFNAGAVSFAHATSDVVIMPPGEPAVMGTEAATAWATAFLSEVTVDLAYTTDNFFVSGDWAVEPYAGTAVITPAGGGDAIQEVVKGIHIYRRQADGSWKMSHDAWNFDAPPPGSME